MREQRFNVVFFGILQADKSRAVVMDNMAKLFKTEPARLKPYFSGGRKVIKENINAAAAEKYITALENVGLVIKLEEITEPQLAACDDTDADRSINVPTDVSLAPVGVDIIETPQPMQIQEIADFSHITLAEVGSDVLENPVKVTPQVIEDFSYLTLKAAGTHVTDAPQTKKGHLKNI